MEGLLKCLEGQRIHHVDQIMYLRDMTGHVD